MAKYEGPYKDLREFQDEGWLHEINRLLLHPAGLALALDFETGKALVWVSDDPEGWEFGGDLLSSEKAESVARLWQERLEARQALFGSNVQRTKGRALTTTPAPVP